MLNSVQDRLECVRSYLLKENFTAILFSVGDPHGSEYPSPCDQWIRYLTGFSGSNATVVIFADGLRCFWTDGRYHIQAEQQLEGQAFEIFKEGLDGVPSPAVFLSDSLHDADVLALPEDYISADLYASLRQKLGDRVELKGIELDGEVGKQFWPGRPERRASDAWILSTEYTGEKVENKIEGLRRRLSLKAIDHYIVAALEATAWLFNLRGDDIACTPVLYAYAVVGREDGALYLQDHSRATLPEEYINSLEQLGIQIRSYVDFYADLEKLKGVCAFDSHAVSRRIERICRDSGETRSELNADMIPQSIKNHTQRKKMHRAHLLDGIALTKLIYDLKVSCADQIGAMTEWDVACRLEEKRKQYASYLEPSFATISAYGENAAICHYTPGAEESKALKEEGFLLIDCGGQYLEGTTDVTRTIALGPLTYEQKQFYTAVLKGHLRLMFSTIDPLTPTRKLDRKAREPLWELGADYMHGTGHGVGFVLSVHEDPVRIVNVNNKKMEDHPLQLGHVVSDEPGYYREGAFGIRIENLLTVERTAGRRLYFDPLTVVPYEPEAILTEMLSEEDKNWLNIYQAHVYQVLAPHLSEDERIWLKEQTAPVE